VYTDESHVPDDYRPTRKNIGAAIKWLLQAVPKGSESKCNLFFHYSGHGSWTYDKNGDETDKRDESICPVDYAKAGCILDDELHSLMVAPIADNENVLLTCLFDCCHSGTALDLRYDHEVECPTPELRTYKTLQNKANASTKCKVILWSGCLDNQTSADAYIERKSQGAMTWGFLTVIRQFQASRPNLSYKKVLSNIQDLLLKNKYEQIPHLSTSTPIALNECMTF
jgi:hypothetical protein